MFEKSMELIVKETKNPYIKNMLSYEKEKLNDFCTNNNFKL